MRQEAFLALVERAAGSSRQQAETAVRATLRTLAERITLGEAEEIAAFLPSELRGDLMSAPEPAEPYGVDEFAVGRQAKPPQHPLIHRVADLAGLDVPTARRAVDAVLETLAVRISEGEVEDLITRLGPDLKAALERGLWESRKATRMSLDEFLDRVGEHLGIDHDEAERITRAVFAALGELVSSKEIRDVESELPKEYAPLFSSVV
jgi:uncharacterized protein (DUF2267 family)